MNKNIENILKEALENHDAGYVPGAWEKMSTRLDGTTPTPFYKKWWVAAAFGTALVGSATFFLLNDNSISEKQSEVTVSAPKTQNEIATPTKNITHKNLVTNLIEQPSNENNISNNPNSEKTISSGYGSASCYGIRNPHTTPTVFPVVIPSEIIAEGNTGTSTTQKYDKLNLPKSICLGEEMKVQNTNEALSIVVIEPSGRRVVLAAGKSAEWKVTESGTIRVISGETENVIAIHENKSDLYIDVDASLLFENGIPSVKFKVPGESNLTWTSNIKGTEVKGDSYIVHPYTEKQVSVTVSSENEFGCIATEKQTITINEPYNLLAAKGLNTNSPDVRNRTFMPYALTQRTNVSFELIIIDPRTGATVYSTSDSSDAWDGIDKRTGEMVKLNTVWPWRVLMKNPNQGEPKEYSGTITVL